MVLALHLKPSLPALRTGNCHHSVFTLTPLSPSTTETIEGGGGSALIITSSLSRKRRCHSRLAGLDMCHFSSNQNSRLTWSQTNSHFLSLSYWLRRFSLSGGKFMVLWRGEREREERKTHCFIYVCFILFISAIFHLCVTLDTQSLTMLIIVWCFLPHRNAPNRRCSFWVTRWAACYLLEVQMTVFTCRVDGCHWVPCRSKPYMFYHHNGCKATFIHLLG